MEYRIITKNGKYRIQEQHEFLWFKWWESRFNYEMYEGIEGWYWYKDYIEYPSLEIAKKRISELKEEDEESKRIKNYKWEVVE